MSIIRDLLVKIRGDSSGLDKTVDGVIGKLGKLGAKAGEVGALLTKGLGLGVAAVGAYMVAATRSALKYGDELDSLSKRLNMSTEGVASLRYAASQMGVDFNELAGSIGLMTKNIANAAVQGGPLTNTLNSIGLSAKTLAGMSPEDQFNEIVKSLSSMGSEANRTQAAYAIFGRSASAVLPMIREGAKALEEAQAEAKRLGIALDGVDVAKLDMAGDAMSKTKDAAQGLSNTIGLELSPYIAAAANLMTEWLIKGRPLVGSLHRAFLMMGAAITNAVAGSVAGASTMLNAFIKGAKAALNTLPFIELDASTGGLEGVIAKATDMANKAGEGFKELGAGDGSPVFKKFQAQAEEAGAKAKEAVKGVTTEIKEVKKEAEKPLKITWDDEFNDAWDAINKRVREGQLKAMDPLQRGLERYSDTLKEAQKNGEDWAGVTERGMKSLEDAFLETATTGKLAFGDMFKSISNDIARIIIQRGVTQPLGNAISGAIGGFDFSKVFGSLFGGARAGGGDVTSGKAYLVGEKGPEIHVPDGNGTIIPNNKLGGMGSGGVTVQQNLHIGLGVQEGVKQQLSVMMPSILQQTQQSVQVAIERGGNMSKSVGRR